MEKYLDLIVAICGAITVIVPMGISLFKTIKKLITEKNYAKIVSSLCNFIGEAEGLFDNGVDKKSYVLDKVDALAKELGCEVDANKINEEIEKIVYTTKQVNANTPK